MFGPQPPCSLRFPSPGGQTRRRNKSPAIKIFETLAIIVNGVLTQRSRLRRSNDNIKRLPDAPFERHLPPRSSAPRWITCVQWLGYGTLTQIRDDIPITGDQTKALRPICRSVERARHPTRHYFAERNPATMSSRCLKVDGKIPRACNVL
jgi:hypothetical protein